MKFVRVIIFLSFALALSGFAQSAPLQRGYTIAGVVVDERSGQPLANSTVSIAPATSQTDGRSVTTGPNGHFEFTGLAVGKYSMVGKRRGYLEQGFDQHEQYASAIAVGPDQDASHLVFRLHPDAAIRGRIVDENNEPVPQMQIWLFNTRNDLGRRSTRMITQTTSNDLGEYSFAHLEEGTYYLLAMGRPWYATGQRMHVGVPPIKFSNDGIAEPPPEHRQIVEQESALLDKSYPMTFFDNVQDWTQASGIDLGPGDRFTADFRVAAVPSATLRMSASNPEEPSQGPTRMRILLRAKVFGDELIPVNVNYSMQPDGSSVATGIAPGHYVVQVRGSDLHSFTQEMDISGDMDISKASEESGVVVKGKFAWEGEPVTRGFGVQILDTKKGKFYYCIPQPGGEFTVAESVAPGKYEINVGSPQGDLYIKSVEIGGVVSSSEVQFKDGTNVNMTITIGRGTGTIDGVALLDGKPRAGVMVVLVPAEGWIGTARFRRDQSDSDGTFTLRHVVPGNYKVIALRDGWKLPWSDPKTMKSFLTEGTSVQIAASEKKNVSVKIK